MYMHKTKLVRLRKDQSGTCILIFPKALEGLEDFHVHNSQTGTSLLIIWNIQQGLPKVTLDLP